MVPQGIASIMVSKGNQINHIYYWFAPSWMSYSEDCSENNYQIRLQWIYVAFHRLDFQKLFSTKCSAEPFNP